MNMNRQFPDKNIASVVPLPGKGCAKCQFSAE